ncbi:MAG TPA: hypothetical protein VGL09_16050 [Methylomirabilota bacterium]
MKDAATLESLVTKHASSLEPGLAIVETSALLGESTIDLVGVGHDGALVLIALGLVGDGGMILRALGAYAWCVEYPDAVRQRYRAARRELRWPPRIVFMAEGLPESFVRKVKRLGVPSIECVEFRALESNGTSALRFERRQRVRLDAAGVAAAPVTPVDSPAAPPATATPNGADPLADGDPVAEAVIAITTAADEAKASRVPAAAAPRVPAPSAPAPPAPAVPPMLVPEPVRLQTPEAVVPAAPPVAASAGSASVVSPNATPSEAPVSVNTPPGKPVAEMPPASRKGARGRTRRRKTPAWPPTPSMLSADEKRDDDEDGDA